MVNRLGVSAQLDSLRKLYATKSDDELLLLATERASLVENARLALADEMSRRNLDDPFVPDSVVPLPAKVAPQPDSSIGLPGRAPAQWVGLFFFNTVVVFVCSTYVSIMLVGRWFAWLTPILGSPSNVTPADWYLRHLEVVTIVPALIAGYLDLGRFLPAMVGRDFAKSRSGSSGMWVWIIPTASLLYKMLRFQAPSSVLIGSSMTAFRYLFEIEKVMPTLSNPDASDPVRVLAQMYVTAPFYAGLAYSMGSLAWNRRWLTVLFEFAGQAKPSVAKEQ